MPLPKQQHASTAKQVALDTQHLCAPGQGCTLSWPCCCCNQILLFPRNVSQRLLRRPEAHHYEWNDITVTGLLPWHRSLQQSLLMHYSMCHAGLWFCWCDGPSLPGVRHHILSWLELLCYLFKDPICAGSD